jgi:peroxiredoxin
MRIVIGASSQEARILGQTVNAPKPSNTVKSFRWSAIVRDRKREKAFAETGT